MKISSWFSGPLVSNLTCARPGRTGRLSRRRCFAPECLEARVSLSGLISITVSNYDPGALLQPPPVQPTGTQIVSTL